MVVVEFEIAVEPGMVAPEKLVGVNADLFEVVSAVAFEVVPVASVVVFEFDIFEPVGADDLSPVDLGQAVLDDATADGGDSF